LTLRGRGEFPLGQPGRSTKETFFRKGGRKPPWVTHNLRGGNRGRNLGNQNHSGGHTGGPTGSHTRRNIGGPNRALSPGTVNQRDKQSGPGRSLGEKRPRGFTTEGVMRKPTTAKGGADHTHTGVAPPRKTP